ncbi:MULTISPECIES: hypothetical protein [Pseudomonas]|uniref:Uncharacterized protein n=1 Tax=Pseudomonas lutea TaxID=243924 RepID=A0A9X8ME79_9PSED|nr:MULTISPECIES: hypothetical protein [Pseudomonas]MCG7374991.1 hypothetical protein [Pseudomonas luteola]SEQ83552.1 hypothetical protein SAMN05216409_10957 [Pseudomonas lutea]
MTNISTGQRARENHSVAYQDALVELGKGIALGLVPILGQAIDTYDTVESAIRIYTSKNDAEKEEAQFDLLLSFIGWIPGPGDGVKKSLRIVNKDPNRYAPVLFDLLRFVLQECGVKSSPEALLAQIFDAGALNGQIDEIIEGVRHSSTFDALPRVVRNGVLDVLVVARDNLPALVGLVEKRLLKWKRLQRNNSGAESSTSRPATQPKPAARDAQVAKEGRDSPAGTHSNGVDRSTIGTRSLADLSNDLLGVSGEHIADYICANELGWGHDWDGHDKGCDGVWLEGTPSGSKLGKLSSGGSPKAKHILYKLTDPPNGTGIDAVWRADPLTNNGKRFAIVEAKASREEDGPKFLRKPGNTRKPSITSTLGASGIPEKAKDATDPSELLEPIENESAGLGYQRNAKASGRKRSRPRNSSTSQEAKSPTAKKVEILVQMSHEWIYKNLSTSSLISFRAEIISSYSRHLFFSPLYHPSGSPMEHAVAALKDSDESKHRLHKAFHFKEDEIKIAVNKRKRKLSQKHGNQNSLRLEA